MKSHCPAVKLLYKYSKIEFRASELSIPDSSTAVDVEKLETL